jgi:spectrin beta
MLNSLSQSPLAIEEQPAIDLRGSTIELASDYTKKKNVFRILLPSGQSEYLLQADTASEMGLWLHYLQDAAGSPKVR